LKNNIKNHVFILFSKAKLKSSNLPKEKTLIFVMLKKVLILVF
jgi:hypothetical protein